MPRPISISMTPAYYDEEHVLLRAQLKCLSLQTCKDFDIWMIDPHYWKRRAVIPELVERFKLDIKHIPYTPNTRVAKNFDCAIFNAAFCYSQAPINARFSCYRFVKPGFVEAALSAPAGVNVDFYMLAVGPCVYEAGIPGKIHSKHFKVWNFESEDVDWSRFPARSGYSTVGCPSGVMEDSLGNWHPDYDRDSDVMTVPLTLYGNLAWRRDQWLEINGSNEVVTNAAHWEDLDFDYRANRAGQKVIRKTGLLYRLHHNYGWFSQRSNIEVDVPFKKFCESCKQQYRNSGDADYGNKLQRRIETGEVDVYSSCQAWVCKTCKLAGPIYGADGIDGYLASLASFNVRRAPILKQELLGRNLKILADDMDQTESVSRKVEIFNDSWSNPRYYETD